MYLQGVRPDYDLCIVGGGINGAGIARDAAGCGLSVLLVEAGDLGAATSSASTKLIHGGLRYLEYYEFHLVRESLREREKLLRIAPHIIRPLEFVLPLQDEVRPAWMIRAGLFLYDWLGGRGRLPRSAAVDMASHPYGDPLNPSVLKGFSYSDCWTDDARLVVLNAMDARSRGAEVLTRTACLRLSPQPGGGWDVHLRSNTNGEFHVHAGMVVNATGPWARQFLDVSNLCTAVTPKVRLVKGSHIVVPQMFDGEQAYILQQPDRRVVFAIPYEGRFTLIGTTEENYTGDPARPAISPSEAEYLCTAFNRSFRTQIGTKDVVWTYSGVRPLLDDGEGSATAVTRDYKLHEENSAPFMLSVFGGKITTYRRLARKVVDRLLEKKGLKRTFETSEHALPGGDIPGADLDGFVEQQKRLYPWLPEDTLIRYARSYGTRMSKIVSGATSIQDMGESFEGLYEAEIRYLMREEFAQTAEDILWRRTKMGLHVSAQTACAITDFISQETL